MDDIRFTKHTTLIDFRALFKSVPSIYSFRPRANPKATIAVLTDTCLDLARKGKTVGSLNSAGDDLCKGRHAAGRLRALGHTSNETVAITGRITDLILNDETGVKDVIFSSRFSPYENLGWFMDKSPKNSPYMVAISHHRVIVNGKQHSLEWYRDKYLPSVLKKRMRKEVGYFNEGELRLMPPRLMVEGVERVYKHLAERVEVAQGSL